MSSLVYTFALIGVAGVGSQWLAWRLRLPGIVLMLAAGVVVGPMLGILNPEADFGAALGPMVSVAVALILFEGGLTLNVHGLRDAGPAVRRLVIFGAPIGWITGTLAAHYVAGLSWQVAAVFGGVLVVTGPTVIIPLLRQAKLKQRPAQVLRWEAIVNDSVGALFAVLAYEFAAMSAHGETLADVGWWLVGGVLGAGIIGYVAGIGAARAFQRGLVPEYMKAPALFASVIAVFAVSNAILEESGLLAVTVMGVVLGNKQLPSLAEIRRFKEHITVLLVSGVFVLLAATLDAEMIALLDWRALAFVLVVMFVARPLAIFLSLIGTKLEFNEKLLIAWVAPRGVVAVAVSGFFGAKLAALGLEDGAALAPLAFAVVAVTVVVHGFTVSMVARRLNLVSSERPGVLIVGATRWSVALAKALKELEVPVLVTDRNWTKLRQAKQSEIPTFYGEVLSDHAEHALDLSRFGYLIAATDNDAYNALVCTDFGPEFGRGSVFQIGRAQEGGGDPHAMPVTLGGRMLFRSGASFDELERKARDGWVFTRTKLTDEFTFDDYLEKRAEGAELLLDAGSDGALSFSTVSGRPKGKSGETMLSYAPARPNTPTEAKA